MTIPQSLETLRTYVRHLELVNDRTYAEDPASGEVKLENPYANLIGALHVAIDCMECFTPVPKAAVAMLRNMKQEVNE